MSLIHWWPLNGNLKDCGLLNTTLTNINSTAINNNGKIGKCYYFNGSNNALRAEYPNTTKPVNALSLAGWYKAVSTSSDHYIISCYETGGAGLAGASGSIKFQIYSSGAYSSATASVPDTNWHHWCGTFDGRYIKLYMDGVLKQTTDLGSSGRTITYHSTTCWMMGANPYNDSPAGNYTNGYMNDVRIYDHALSLKEIKEISKGLVLHYNFEISENKNLLYDTKSVTGDSGTDLTITEYTYNGIKGYRLQKTTNSGWGSFLRWVTNYQILDVNKKYSFSVDVVSLNGSNYNIGNFIANDNSNNVFIYNSWKTATTTLQRLKWENLTPNSSFTKEERVNNVGWHLILNTVPLDIFIANPKLEVGDVCTTFTPYMTNSNNTSDYDDGKTIYDNSGNGYNGITNGALRILGNSPSGNHCAKFDSNIYIDIPTLPELKSATISFWAKIPTNTTVYRSIFNRKNSPTGGLWLSLNTESYGMWSYVASSPSYSGAGAKIAADTWYLFTFVFDNGVANWYQNGVYVGRNITYDTYKAIASANYCLGDSYTGSSWDGTPFDGSIADFKIYATALSAADILAEYNRKASIDRDGNLYTGEFVEKNDRINIAKTDVIEASVFEEGTSLVKMTDKYIELEYIGLSGAQQIDTGTKFNMQSGSCEITFQASTTSQNGMLIASTSGNYFWLYYYSNANKINLYVYASGQKNIQGNTLDLNKHTIVYKNRHMYIDENDKGSFAVTLSETSGNVYIGSYGGNYFFQGKVFNCRIYDSNGAMIRNFIPAKRKSDNVIGMYDTVNRQFYTNSGSGSFTAGPEKGNLSIVYSKQIIEN